MLAIQTNGHSDVLTPKSVCWWLQLLTCQLGLQQNIPWWWEPGLLRNIQQLWTAVWPKESSQFLLSPIECRHQPRPGLRVFRPWQPTARQTWSKIVPVVTTLALPQNATKTQGSLPTAIQCHIEIFAGLIGSAFAFLQVNLLKDCHLQTQQTSSRCTKIFAGALCLRPNNVSHVAAARIMCHTGINSARASIAPSSELLCGLTLIKVLWPYFLNWNRSRNDGRKLSIRLTFRTLAARCGAPSTNSLACLYAPLACALFQQTPSPPNLWRTG